MSNNGACRAVGRGFLESAILVGAGRAHITGSLA